MTAVPEDDSLPHATTTPDTATAMTATVQETMNATVADLLTCMGFEVEPFGAGCSLVTDMRGRG